MTDDFSAVEEVQKLRPQWDVKTLATPDSHNGFWELEGEKCYGAVCACVCVCVCVLCVWNHELDLEFESKIRGVIFNSKLPPLKFLLFFQTCLW